MQRIGILSDSHDHLDHLEQAVNLLAEQDIDAWIHLGDLIAPFVAKPLRCLPGPHQLIFGNNDGEVRILTQAFGAAIEPGPKTLDWGGRSWLLMHEPYALDAAIAAQTYDFVLYGHTHKADLRREGRTVVLNPGEICGWLTRRPTCAVIDLGAGRTRVYGLDGAVVAELTDD
ncbi:MAG: metallophosphoesterase [Candidatus Dadabacteria bacterium]|nr:MAG: metallophosphoesterase [Candidatus Dadabacteria bacterium]